MNSERWLKAMDIFHAALKREPESRQRFVLAACGEDSALHREVQLLIEKGEQAGSFLERPAFAPRPDETPQTLNLVGRQAGPYRIVCKLGSGGMGEVYRAHDDKLDRDVAIKVLPAEFAHDPERLARFRREARLLASLNHPNIAAIYGLEESGGIECLVLEFVEGETLRGPLPIRQTLEIACQVADALEAAHSRGIIHRDLKPANIKLTAQGGVKMLDFGLAKAALGDAELVPARDAECPTTIEGQILGTPGYMSPEQVRGIDVDAQSDTWAFGCLLYELLAGRRAFDGETVPDILAAVLEREPQWQFLPRYTPREIRDLLRQCLEKDASRRPHTISEARRVLLKAQARYRFLATRRPVMALATVVLLLAALWGVREYRHSSRVRWVREEVVPEVHRLWGLGERKAAFHLVQKAEALLPDDPALLQVHREISFPTMIGTNPPGAEVWAAEYAAEKEEWIYLGRTPFTIRKLPQGYYRFRIAKPGFHTILVSGGMLGDAMSFDLDRGEHPGGYGPRAGWNRFDALPGNQEAQRLSDRPL